MTDIPESGLCKDEWTIYLNIALELDVNSFDCTQFSLIGFWNSFRTRIPKLYNVA